MVSQREVLEYGQRVVAAKPGVHADELRAALEARFFDGKDVLVEAERHGGYQAWKEPMNWLHGLSSILRGLRRMCDSGKKDVNEQVIIDAVVVLLVEKR